MYYLCRVTQGLPIDSLEFTPNSSKPKNLPPLKNNNPYSDDESQQTDIPINKANQKKI